MSQVKGCQYQFSDYGTCGKGTVFGSVFCKDHRLIASTTPTTQPAPYGHCPRCRGKLDKGLNGLYCHCGYPEQARITQSREAELVFNECCKAMCWMCQQDLENVAPDGYGYWRHKDGSNCNADTIRRKSATILAQHRDVPVKES